MKFNYLTLVNPSNNLHFFFFLQLQGSLSLPLYSLPPHNFNSITSKTVT
ncbi:unnamed protein product [Brassica rapa]|uniref:Uncharacterized protein n=1 Tax=Brassica campestris TaxID=3711 RepID=A0A8D9MFG3_BRACM|nr:unnamed protein product [Brassica rapa]